VAVFVALTVVLLLTAWMSDDAYITFRVADNAVHGYGFRWNVDERVQVFTHPLWFLVFTACYAVTREPYFTSIALNLLFALLTAAAVVRMAPTRTAAALGLIVLICSKAFVDFSSSGLENSLTHALLALFVAQWWSGQDGPRSLMTLTLTTSLLLLNRLDVVVLVAPAWIVRAVAAARRHGFRPAAAAAVAGGLPLVGWIVFSIVYYGFPFPNTAYAKLATGLPAAALARQGLRYFLWTFWFDPVTLVAIAAVPTVLWRWRIAALHWPWIAGSVLMCLYLLRIGGDFMFGRFLTPPLVVSVLIFVRVADRLPDRAAVVASLALIAVGGAAYATSRMPPGRQIDGVTDERKYYYWQTGLLRAGGGLSEPYSDWMASGAALGAAGVKVSVQKSVGMVGFFAGPGVHVIDVHALTDPLLARLPCECAGDWRIGHFRRAVPDGYVESIATGENRLSDPQLAAYYGALRWVVSAPLFERRRWRAIAAINFGRLQPRLSRTD
jgi:arabinofuranosyltransferase